MGCPDAELSIIITDDAGIQALNRSWRGKDKPTDVLSFSQLEWRDQHGRQKRHDPRRVLDGAVKPVLGDVVISIDSAAAQAQRFGHSLQEEALRLLVHGVLHLLGHDHVHGGWQARIMRDEERRLWAIVGAPTFGVYAL